MFSGGMDSFIGAIDLLEGNIKVSFVSHYKRGADKSAQTKMYDNLRKKYGNDSFINYQFYLQPNRQHKNATKEETSRARSFLFLCLGLIIANTLDEKIDFIVPENGLISLNVPLTGTRLSSHSTRTTHPYYISTFKKVILELGINNKIINPYQWKTKGEMMVECDNQNLLKSFNAETLSCSHSENSRYSGMKPGIQCGYCVPCIIRQAAEKKGGIIGTEHVYNITKSIPSQKLVSGSDIRAFKLSLKRLETKSIRNIMFDILSSGPLPFENRNELNEYINVYKRGMNEVKELENNNDVDDVAFFESLIVNVVNYNDTVSILFFQDTVDFIPVSGEILKEFEKRVESSEYFEYFKRSHVSISINEIAQRFIINDIPKESRSDKFTSILSEREHNLLKIIRKGFKGLKSVTIQTKDNELHKMDVTTTKKATAESILIQHFQKGDYKSVKIEAVDGNIVYFEETEKYIL